MHPGLISEKVIRSFYGFPSEVLPSYPRVYSLFFPLAASSQYLAYQPDTDKSSLKQKRHSFYPEQYPCLVLNVH